MTGSLSSNDRKAMGTPSTFLVPPVGRTRKRYQHHREDLAHDGDTDLRRTPGVRDQEIGEKTCGSVLTAATASFTHGLTAAGLTIPRVKPGLGTRHPSGNRSGESGNTYSRPLHVFLWHNQPSGGQTLRNDDFGPELGARWSRLCDANHVQI